MTQIGRNTPCPWGGEKTYKRGWEPKEADRRQRELSPVSSAKMRSAIKKVVWQDRHPGASAQNQESLSKGDTLLLSLIPGTFKFIWTHFNVAKNTPQSSDFERTVAMNGNGCPLGIPRHDMMAPAYPNHRKAL
jgi:hypothetical protein